jgi:hypothetical protein
MPYFAYLEVSLYQVRLKLSWICTIESIRLCMSCWVVTRLEREQPQYSIVVFWKVGVKGLKNVWKVLLADGYGNLTVTLEMK